MTSGRMFVVYALVLAIVAAFIAAVAARNEDAGWGNLAIVLALDSIALGIVSLRDR